MVSRKRSEKWEEYQMNNTISRAELARQLGVSRTYVTLLIQGKRTPSQLVANKIKQLTLTTYIPEQEHLTCMVGYAVR